jgi:hypothetical protein
MLNADLESGLKVSRNSKLIIGSLESVACLFLGYPTLLKDVAWKHYLPTSIPKLSTPPPTWYLLLNYPSPYNTYPNSPYAMARKRYRPISYC